MKKMKKCSKGFTLTELAVVIAVIAILIAVLVPTFVSLINKAEESNDKQLVKNLNTSLSTYETLNGETDGVLGAIAALKEEGYDVTKLTPTSDGAVIVYNTTAHAFVLYADDFKSILYGEASDGDNLVVIGCTTATATAASSALGVTEYCVYSEDGASVECTVEDVTVYVYTESGTTTINAPSAEVYHYGSAETVNITEVASASYHLYAQVETVKIAKGHVVVEDGASITKLVVNTTTEKTVTTTLSDNGSIGRVVTADSTFTVKDSNGTTVTTISTTVVTSIAQIEKMDTVTYISSVPETMTSGTYVLTANITGNFVIPEGEVVTINLNGWTITGGTGASNNVAIYNNGMLTITGSGNVVANGTGTDAAVYSEYGAKTYIDGGTYTQGKWYLLHNYGYMEINEANIIGNSKSSSVVHNGYQNYANDGGNNDEAVMIINGLSFSNDTEAELGTSSLIKNDDMGNLTINDGSFKNAPAWVLLNWHICTINGGEFSGDACIGAYGDGSDTDKGIVTINGGTFLSTSTNLEDTSLCSVISVYGAYGSAANAASVIVNGGTFESAGKLLIASKYSSLVINGGTFTHTNSDTSAIIIRGDSASVTITGGTINYNANLISISENISYTYTNDATLNQIG